MSREFARIFNSLADVAARELDEIVEQLEPKAVANILAGMSPDKFAEISNWFSVTHPLPAEDVGKMPRRVHVDPVLDNWNRNLASQINENTPALKPVLEEAFKNFQPRDMVNHPAHYNAGKFEVIDVIDDWKLNFARGCVVKYVGRAQHKGSELEDLRKAAWYLNYEIERIEKRIANAVAESVAEHMTSSALGLAKEGFMCSFCKSANFRERADDEQVFCFCGATVKWPLKAGTKPYRAEGTERELCELTSKLMTMTETSKLDDALRDLQIAWDFVMKHEERNPTHLLLIVDDKGSIACGKKDSEISSVVTVGNLSEVTCKECRVAFLRSGK